MKNWKKTTKIRIILGICMILAAIGAAFLLDGFTGPESAMWQRMVFIVVVLGTGLSGLFGMLLGLWGFVGGYVFVLLLSAPQALPDPWNRYFAVVYFAGLFALPTLKKQKKGKRSRSAENASDALLKQETLSPEEQFSELSENPMVVLNTGSGRIYQLIRFGGELRAYRAGGELKGVDFDALQSESNPLRPLGKQDLSIPLSTVRSVRCKELPAGNQLYDCLAVVKTESKTYRFAPSIITDSSAFLDFWRRVAPDAVTMPKQQQASGETPDKQRLEILKKVYLGICIYAVAVNLAWMFLDVPYALFSLLSMLALPAILVLYFCFPAEITLNDAKRKDPRIAPVGTVMLCGIPSALRTMMDFNFQNWGRCLILFGILFAILLAISMLLSREWVKHKIVILSLVFALLSYSFGMVGQVNYIFDTSQPSSQAAVITEMRISTSSKGPDSYYLTVIPENGSEQKLRVGKSTYENLSVGSIVTVSTYSGFLGIPYTFAQ